MLSVRQTAQLFVYFDLDAEIPWKDHWMQHWGLWVGLWDWFILDQKDLGTRQHFDTEIFPFKPSGLCPQVETLELQQSTERI